MKKLLISGLLLLSTLQLFASVIPYENTIAREYNRINVRGFRYTSMHQIINQSMRGKSDAQRNQILTDVRALRQAIAIASQQAEIDGHGLWYCLYTVKDNQGSIDTLAEYAADIDEKLASLEWQIRSDSQKFIYYATKYTAICTAASIATILVLYASQKHWPTDRPPALLEMAKSPFLLGFHTIMPTLTKTVSQETPTA